MRALDSSVVVAAFASWHEKHAAARKAVDAGARLVDHAALEAFSVLTRLPAPHRAPADLVGRFLTARFKGSLLRLDARKYRAFVAGLPGLGISGGAVYDALIATTALDHDATLLTCDRRARLVYDRIGVRVQLV